ncbi:hypothetical protein GUJ93_ZPchr0002g23349 [Zizania palustris]|uniref:Uncharacterized protein n=1 Tax=Zizania palustris TaxID=103762 RepID=A0A8J5VGS6_ZIZPA|nr:hypothetical protein GUJ93_ZPchr0002g23349 [Zizania palustris]
MGECSTECEWKKRPVARVDVHVDLTHMPLKVLLPLPLSIHEPSQGRIDTEFAYMFQVTKSYKSFSSIKNGHEDANITLRARSTVTSCH